MNKIEIKFDSKNNSLCENYDILTKIIESIGGFDDHFLYVLDDTIIIQYR